MATAFKLCCRRDKDNTAKKNTVIYYSMFYNLCGSESIKKEVNKQTDK